MCEAWQNWKHFTHTYVNVNVAACGHDVGGVGVNEAFFVHAIDPETGNLILLCKPDEDSHRHAAGDMTIAFASAVTAIQALDHAPANVQPECPFLSLSSASRSTRCAPPSPFKNGVEVLAFLQSHRIEGCMDEETGSISVFQGLATVLPPYHASCVKCTNDVVLGRIRNLLQM